MPKFLSMATNNSDRKVVVFDLDDTLYPEFEYRNSGLRAVCDFVGFVYGFGLAPEDFYDKTDALGDICRQANLPLEVKNSLLWIYRLHLPEISLGQEVSSLVRDLSSKFDLAILTDGRSVTQRLKIRALGLNWIPSYISEEYGKDKPDPERFLAIMADYPGREYVYIGDNPRKDFLAPNKLGWLTIGVRGGVQNIHTQLPEGLDADYLPMFWLDSLNKIPEFLC